MPYTVFWGESLISQSGQPAGTPEDQSFDDLGAALAEACRRLTKTNALLIWRPDGSHISRSEIERHCSGEALIKA